MPKTRRQPYEEFKETLIKDKKSKAMEKEYIKNPSNSVGGGQISSGKMAKKSVKKSTTTAAAAATTESADSEFDALLPGRGKSEKSAKKKSVATKRQASVSYTHLTLPTKA